MYTCIKTEGTARRGVFETVHGTIQTPFFMNVGTAAAIKGGISSIDLANLKCQVELCNTYHLHLRPGDTVIRQMGGLHKFMHWNKPILTDSGGFRCSRSQSCGKSRKRAFISNPILTENGFSWDRKKACRFNPIWLLPLLWHSMNA